MDMTLYALLMSKLKNKESETLNGVKIMVVEAIPSIPEQNTLYILLENTNGVN